MSTPKPASGAVPMENPIVTVEPIECRKRRDSRKGGVGLGGSDAMVAEGTAIGDRNVDMANALAKIRALTGMTRVQVSVSPPASGFDLASTRWLHK